MEFEDENDDSDEMFAMLILVKMMSLCADDGHELMKNILDFSMTIPLE